MQHEYQVRLNECGKNKPLQFSSPCRMEVATVLYFLRKGIKLHFYSLDTIFEENIRGVQRGAGLRWRPQNAKRFEALTEPAGETHPSALGFQ